MSLAPIDRAKSVRTCGLLSCKFRLELAWGDAKKGSRSDGNFSSTVHANIHQKSVTIDTRNPKRRYQHSIHAAREKCSRICGSEIPGDDCALVILTRGSHLLPPATPAWAFVPSPGCMFVCGLFFLCGFSLPFVPVRCFESCQGWHNQKSVLLALRRTHQVETQR